MNSVKYFGDFIFYLHITAPTNNTECTWRFLDSQKYFGPKV